MEAPFSSFRSVGYATSRAALLSKGEFGGQGAIYVTLCACAKAGKGKSGGGAEEKRPPMALSPSQKAPRPPKGGPLQKLQMRQLVCPSQRKRGEASIKENLQILLVEVLADDRVEGEFCGGFLITETKETQKSPSVACHSQSQIWFSLRFSCQFWAANANQHLMDGQMA